MTAEEYEMRRIALSDKKISKKEQIKKQNEAKRNEKKDRKDKNKKNNKNNKNKKKDKKDNKDNKDKNERKRKNNSKSKRNAKERKCEEATAVLLLIAQVLEKNKTLSDLDVVQQALTSNNCRSISGGTKNFCDTINIGHQPIAPEIEKESVQWKHHSSGKLITRKVHTKAYTNKKKNYNNKLKRWKDLLLSTQLRLFVTWLKKENNMLEIIASGQVGNPRHGWAMGQLKSIHQNSPTSGSSSSSDVSVSCDQVLSIYKVLCENVTHAGTKKKAKTSKTTTTMSTTKILTLC